MSAASFGPDDPLPPAWLDGAVLFAHFWRRMGLALAVMAVSVAGAGIMRRWSGLHHWTNGLVLAGLGCWVAALVLFALVSVAGLRSREPASAPPRIGWLLPWALVLAFAGFVPLAAGLGIAALPA